MSCSDEKQNNHDQTRRHEAISELILITKESFYRIFTDIFKEAKANNKSRSYLLRDIQLQLKTIKLWTTEKLRYECARFKNIDQVKTLLGVIYELSHTLENLVVPTMPETLLENFVRETSLSIARDLWNKVYIVYELFEERKYDVHQETFEKILITNIKICARMITKPDADAVKVAVSEKMQDVFTKNDVIHPVVQEEVHDEVHTTPTTSENNNITEPEGHVELDTPEVVQKIDNVQEMLMTCKPIQVNSKNIKKKIHISDSDDDSVYSSSSESSLEISESDEDYTSSDSDSDTSSSSINLNKNKKSTNHLSAKFIPRLPKSINYYNRYFPKNKKGKQSAKRR